MENVGYEPHIVHGTLHGPGYSGGNGIGAAYKVARLMADAPRLQAMAARSQALGRPQAAREVLRRVLGEPRPLAT